MMDQADEPLHSAVTGIGNAIGLGRRAEVFARMQAEGLVTRNRAEIRFPVDPARCEVVT
jgi:hypothetical protein